ncbi:helix-hairpin-helix domain-containing protein [Streptomyces sp. NPDC005012]|uniref:helix-hairpin-helix domain-containing protein n=1 Tax=Streptomyces sp. NPDC005012 TaxID=3154558 RepID=UPI0033AD2989
MTTDPETTEQPEPGPREETTAGAEDPGGDAAGLDGAGAEAGSDGGGAEGAGDQSDGESSDGPDGDGPDGDGDGDGPDGDRDGAEGEGEGEATGTAETRELSEAEAELLAQKLERERIERRKAAKQGPVEAGAKLSGTAADLLAAVRAVEKGEKPVSGVFSEPPAPRRAAVPEPARRPVATPPPAAAVPAAPDPASVEAVRAVLAAGGAPEALAPAAATVLGEGADALLREDPWQLLRVEGVRPEHADAFARALLGPEVRPDDERRGRALTVRVLERAALSGHTALEAPALAAALAAQGVPDPDAALQSAVAEGDVLVFQDALDDAPAPAHAKDAEDPEDPEGGEAERPVRVLVGLERLALAEESLADGLARLANTTPGGTTPGGTEADWEAAAARLGGSAAELVRAVAGHALVLHTGGEAARAEPAALLAAAASLGLRVCAVTHTADGRRRLRAALAGGPVDDRAVVTAAGLLSGAQGPGRDADGALAVDLLVVLDAPQLGVEQAAMVVESLPDGARLVLAGDPSLLWSAGPGRVFADVLAAEVCPRVVSRTPDPGPVGELVSGVGVGELIAVDAPGHEVAIVPVGDPREAVHRTVQLVADSVPRAFGVPPEQTQVVTPGHGGAVGTRVLNAALKERFNPGPGRFAGFDPGDRVAYSPEPGRTVLGRVLQGDAEGLHLDLGGARVVVPPEGVERTLRHGWAVTAHQAVGQRWPAVVVVLPGDAGAALDRAWVYTAFSRADRHLSVVQGVGPALTQAVASTHRPTRTTRLPALLRAPQA